MVEQPCQAHPLLLSAREDVLKMIENDQLTHVQCWTLVTAAPSQQCWQQVSNLGTELPICPLSLTTHTVRIRRY